MGLVVEFFVLLDLRVARVGEILFIASHTYLSHTELVVERVDLLFAALP